jgi:hypothetical protein
MKTNYEQQANEFLQKTNTTVKIDFLKYGLHFDDDKERRDIYNVTIKRGSRQFSFNFGNSLNNSGEYIGHKILCTNEFGRYLFSANEVKDMRKIQFLNRFDIRKNENYKAPTNYDILACLQKYDVGSFLDFCSDFGYNEDSKKAQKIYHAVCKEYDNVCKIWNDSEIELLNEIN